MTQPAEWLTRDHDPLSPLRPTCTGLGSGTCSPRVNRCWHAFSVMPIRFPIASQDTPPARPSKIRRSSSGVAGTAGQAAPPPALCRIHHRRQPTCGLSILRSIACQDAPSRLAARHAVVSGNMVIPYVRKQVPLIATCHFSVGLRATVGCFKNDR